MADTVAALPEGWLSEEEAECLAELAKGGVVLEVGSWLGRSTVAMARTARLVVAIDHHHGPPYDGEGSTLNRFLANLELHQMHNVIPILTGSETGLLLLRGQYDLVFIDGDHEKDAVIRDGLLSWPLLSKDGSIAFHDYGGHIGVTAGVHELADRWQRQLRVPTDTTLAVIQKSA